MALARALYIYYLLCFCKDKKSEVQILIDFGSKVNTMISAYSSKLGFKGWYTNIKAYKINDSIFKMFKIILASF